MNDVQRDWKWSDRYLPEVKRIVGQHLLDVAPLSLDRHEATDLTILKAKNTSIACRIRRGKFHATYANQFTLRSRRISGIPTEFEKIARGHCGLMFYGFAADDMSDRLAAWNLIDLDSFRFHLIMSPDLIRRGENATPDGTSFLWFDVSSFPASPPILVARKAS